MTVIVISGAYVLLRCESKKRNLFIAVLVFSFISLLGYFGEINAVATEEAFLAKRIMYLGVFLSMPFHLLFILDYCDIKVSRKLIAIIVGLPVLIIVSMWTTDYHKLYYVTYELVTTGPVNYLSRTTGPLNLIAHTLVFVIQIPIAGILIYEYIRIHAKSRSRFILLVAGAIICMVSNAIYLLNPLNLNINYGQVAIALTCLLIYINILKYDMFDIVPKASQMALSAMSDAFLITDMDNRLLEANESAKELFPSISELKKYSSVDLVKEWPEELSVVSEKKDQCPLVFNLPDEKYYSAIINPISTDKGKVLGHLVLIHNITESVMLTKDLREIAFTDALTGILNRRQFMNLAHVQLERIKRSNEHGYFIMFDIDNFKDVNDTYGHLIGDKVLQCAVERVKGIIRPYDLFGRYGGEEFVLFAFDMDDHDICILAERLRTGINHEPMVFDELSLTISASFGITSVNAADDLIEIIRLSDEAMYQAKREGRNKVVMR